MISEAYKSRAVQAVLGPDRSDLFPEWVWVNFLNTSGVELSGERAKWPNDERMWTPTETGVTTVNTISVSADGTWIVGRIGLFDAETGGELICSATLPAPVTVHEGQELTILAGELTFRIA